MNRGGARERASQRERAAASELASERGVGPSSEPVGDSEGEALGKTRRDLRMAVKVGINGFAGLAGISCARRWMMTRSIS